MSSGTPSRNSSSGAASGSRLTKTSGPQVSTADREQRDVLVAQRAEALAARHLTQLTAQVPGPAVEPAPQLGEPASRPFAQRVAAVPAHVLEHAQLAVVAPHDEHRQPPDAVLEEVTGRGDMVDRAGQLPDPGPEPLLLERRPLRRRVPGRRDEDRRVDLEAHAQIMPDDQPSSRIEPVPVPG